MDLYGYIKKYGNKSFKELTLTDADKVILSYLAYIKFDGIVSNEDNKKPLLEVGNRFFETHAKRKPDIMAVQSAIDILEEIIKYPRFQELLLYNYKYEYNGDNEQFGALFIDYDDTHTFIAFKGTDDLVSGWKEDAELSYKFPVIAQARAVSYVNRKIPLFSKRKYILAGHSKGGNLAEVAAMYMKKSRYRKVTKIYSLDGPGLKEKEFFSNRYKRIDPKFELVVPETAFVGMLLKQRSSKTIVKSKKKGILAHNALYWLYDETIFKEGKLSSYSITLDKAIDDWLDQYSPKERKDFINDLFSIMDRAGIESLLSIKENMIKSFIKIVQETKKLDPVHKEKLMSLFKFIIDYTKEDFFNKNNEA